MGVTGLWGVLEDAKEEIAFSELKGTVLAVDLSLWLCQCKASAVKCTYDLPKLNIRNVFYRTVHLLKNGVRPIFVIDGKAPEVKTATISRRLHLATTASGNRPSLEQPVMECRALFDAMGVFHLQSEGEAEALCAYLDKEGLVDGCLTNDGDAFLYGAKTLYPDFAVGNKTISRYQMANVERSLGYNRSALIALAALSGCDYNAGGVFGVGPAQWQKFVNACVQNGREPVEVLREWLLPPVSDNEPPALCSVDPKMTSLYEKVREKLSLETFEGIVSEFTENSLPGPKVKELVLVRKKTALWSCPNLQKLVDLFTSILHWDFGHAREHLFPLLARFRLVEGAYLRSEKQNDLPKAKRIVCRRVNHGQSCFEVEWSWIPVIDLEIATTSSSFEKSDFTTIEPVELFGDAYPQMVETFENLEKQKKESPKKQLKRAESEAVPKNCGDIRSYFGAFPLVPASLDDLIENLQKVSLGGNELVKQTMPQKTPFLASNETIRSWKPPEIPETADEFFGTNPISDEKIEQLPSLVEKNEDIDKPTPRLFSFASIFGSLNLKTQVEFEQKKNSPPGNKKY